MNKLLSVIIAFVVIVQASGFMGTAVFSQRPVSREPATSRDVRESFARVIDGVVGTSKANGPKTPSGRLLKCWKCVFVFRDPFPLTYQFSLPLS